MNHATWLVGVALATLLGCGGIVVFDGEAIGGGGAGGDTTIATTSGVSSSSSGSGMCSTFLAVPWDQACTAYIRTSCCEEAVACEADTECASLWGCIYIDCGEDNPGCVESCFEKWDQTVAGPLFACGIEDPSCVAAECTTSLTSRSLACDEAMFGECCGELQQCEVAANGCGPYFQCVIDCGFEPMCRQGCVDQFPGGVDGSKGLFDCFDRQPACQFDL